MRLFFLAAAALLSPLTPAPARAQPAGPASRPVLREPAPPETARPDSFDDDNDDFRRALLDPSRSDRWLVPTSLGGVLLVVQKGYIDDIRLDSLASDLQEAVAKIPALTGREPRVRKRFTVYVYNDGPPSAANIPGAQPGEKGLMLAFVKEGEDPLFHELTHLLAGRGGSTSLNEGVAEWVQDRLRPGRANAFVPAGADPDALCKAALAKWPSAFRSTIGAPGDWFKGPRRAIVFDYYYCSWSFVGSLLRRKDMKALWRVIDAGGAPKAYRSAYDATYDRLFADWVDGLNRPKP
jgi:hypothetical protein